MFRVRALVAAVFVCVGASFLAVDAAAASTAVPIAGPRGDACGPRVAKASGSWWTCTLAENFDGSSLNTRIWTPSAEKGTSNQACMLNHPRTLAVRDGGLHLTVQPTDEGLTCPTRADGTRASYASASVTTVYKFSQQYGRFEARIKSQATTLPGLQEAFWLWPDVRYTNMLQWPQSGEIDIAEVYSSHPDLVVPFLHYNIDDNGGPVPGLNTAWDCQSSRGEFHTYTLEWTATSLAIFVDGKLCLHHTASAATFQKRFIICLSQLLGVHKNAYVNATGEVATLPATMVVDYVKVWK